MKTPDIPPDEHARLAELRSLNVLDTIAGGQGQRQPSATELDGARFQGRLVAETANKLFGA